MTEEEAKAKWCPFARFNPDGKAAGAVNRTRYDFKEANMNRCLGSACMAWRSYEVAAKTPSRTPYVRYHGSCGLAGKP